MRKITIISTLLVLIFGCDDVEKDKERRVELIIELYQKGDYNQAIREVLAYQKKYPGEDEAWCNRALGNGYSGLFRFEEAVKYFDNALDIGFEEEWETKATLLSKLRALTFMNSQSKSEKLVDFLLLKYPDDADIYIQIAAFYESFGDKKNALFYGEKAYELDDSNSILLNLLAFIYMEKGNYEKAIPLFKKTLEVDPEMFTAMNNLGYTLFLAGEEQEGESFIKRSIENFPANPYSYYQMALIRLSQEDQQGMCDYLYKAHQKKFSLVYGNAVDSLTQLYCQ